MTCDLCHNPVGRDGGYPRGKGRVCSECHEQRNRQETRDFVYGSKDRRVVGREPAERVYRKTRE